MSKRIHGKNIDRSDIASSLNNLGNNYYEMNEYNKASEHYRLCLAMFQRIHGENSDHSDIVVIRNNLVINDKEMTDRRRICCLIS